ncbi:g-protein coupled receptor 1 [Anaeramoeba ignava]|uniref:G-protein coupled receptor 1 n=1 Tax=Anaeramoeba ignava TaxID=1746090 RepID=A0A9Q0LZC4_ANAIG|nr:g-protein coupled receptor 1 [Anaeramoeba ignava]
MKGEEFSTIFGSSLGLTGALLIIIIFLYFKSTKLFYRKLVFILSIYDLFQSLSYLLPGNSNGVICKIQYYLTAIFASTSQFWSAIISLISYLKVVKQIDDKKLNKIHKWFHLIMLIPIIVLIIISAYAHDYDDSKTYWCVLTTESFLLTLYVFIWIYVINCLVFYILTIIQLRKVLKLIKNEKSFSLLAAQKNQLWIQIRMSLIPLIQIIIMIPATIRRLRDIIDPSAPDIIVIDILQSLLVTSQGFWDFWIFVVFDPEMRDKIKGCCCSNLKQKYLQENELSDISTYQKLPNQENGIFSIKNPNFKSSEFKPLIQNSNKEESLN